ncbi:50S ribosomal protein L18 [Alphaproteobacteria bacterium]|nr:50S ribosomal protein L18 [Alphaproteobacteria bacterium]
MNKQLLKNKNRRARVRYALKQRAGGRLRLSIHRTTQHIYAQLVDDKENKTLCSSSTIDPVLKSKLKGSKTDAAILVGEDVAKKAVKLGHKDVVFDRGAYIFHGRIKALAESAREHGLNF